MIGRPKLANLPARLAAASWLEPHPNDPWRVVRRVVAIVRWECVCGASGRHWADERPTRCPHCGLDWETELGATSRPAARLTRPSPRPKSHR